MTVSRQRVLFFAEAVTLAHVARPEVLAASLDPKRYEVHLAAHPRYAKLFDSSAHQRHAIHSISSAQFSQALDRGAVLYDLPTLAAYVEEDLRLMRAIDPDIVVGDFRLSLSVSARVYGRPYFALGNAYWSPYFSQPYPVPTLPIVRVLGHVLAQHVFDLARPLAFRLHARPLNKLRARWGLPPLDKDLRYTYTDADHTVYADSPQLFPISSLPEKHHFIGPVVWSPRLPLPDWWESLPDDRPLVYLNLGSSGPGAKLPRILASLSNFDVTLLVATAGAALTPAPREGIYCTDFLPNDVAMERADVVICNGGSMSCYQAYGAGKPVIAIASNLDQFLNSQAGEAKGLCRVVRADRLDSEDLAFAMRETLAQSEQPSADQFPADGATGFARLLEETVSPSG